MTKEHNTFEAVAHKLDPQSKLLRTWKLKGGVSAQVTALEIEQPGGQVQKVVVRQHGAVDLKHNPQIATDEFKLLQLLQSAGLPTPAPYYFDQSSDILATPYIVIEYIDGKPEFAPTDIKEVVFQLAALLARIHTIDCSQLDISFLPKQAETYAKKLRERPTQLDESLDEGRIRDILELTWPLPQRNASVLLHGDFWPGNILWKDGQLVAVIDWEDAEWGDPLADLANTRLEILWAFGIDAMDSFTGQYASIATIDCTNLPHWDLWAALRPAAKLGTWGLDDVTEKAMREKHRLFINQAFEKISA